MMRENRDVKKMKMILMDNDDNDETCVTTGSFGEESVLFKYVAINRWYLNKKRIYVKNIYYKIGVFF